MDMLINTISLFLLLGLIFVPIFLFVKIKKWKGLKYGFLIYLLVGLLITGCIIWAFAWWTDYSNQILMSNYGYDFNAMTKKEQFENVELKNLEKIKQLEIVFFGIGWPLKAVMTFIFYLPYLLIVYLVGQLILRINR